jgi:exosortase/archaeosortase family protein
MKLIDKAIVSLIIRYLVIVALSLGGLFLIYYVMTPITYFLSLWLLGLFGSVEGFFLERLIIYNGLGIELIDACIAGAAYYLLIVLNLATPMSRKVRAKSLSFSILLFLIINVFRIAIFSVLAYSGWKYFDTAHLLSWYFLSVVMVVGVWCFTIRVFNIKSMPVVDDTKMLLRIIKK